MKQPAFEPAQIDALRELANIGMGRAANALGQLLELEVTLNIPTVEYLQLTVLVDSINVRLKRENLVATRQAFSDGLDGESVLVFKRGRATADDTAAASQSALAAENERLLEITNIIVGSFLGYLMEPLGVDLYFSAPTLLGLPLVAHQIDRGWDSVLVLDVEMGIHAQTDNCKLLLVFPEISIEKIRLAVDELLASI
ncbi:chemotaxis protein CheC [Myxococcota bacterium]